MNELIIEPIEKYGLNISSESKHKPLFSKIGIVGAGKEGRNIIDITASAGMEVVFLEETKSRIDHVMEELNKLMDQKIQSWGLTPSEKKVVMNRITPTLDYNALRGCDLVIESTRNAVTGRRSTPLRKTIFKNLEDVLETDAIIATNGSTVIISELSAGLEHKERCVSLYFSPVHPDARILEISSGMYTSDNAIERMEIFAQLIKFKPHRISESNGNVNMRLMVVMLNEACQILQERITCMENIEETFTIIYGQRFGIFQLADIIGVDRLVAIMEAMFNDFGETHYKPSPLLWKLFRSKQLGIRSGKGFYVYDQEGKRVSVNKNLFH